VTVALLPLKDLVAAKTRLAGLLSPSERRALAQAMAEDVLAVLTAHPALARTVLVSDDPGAALLAGQYEVDYWPESALGGRGLNAVLQRAGERLAAVDPAARLLVLHADLPLLRRDDIDAALDLLGERDIVIGPDRHGTGTNLLACPRAGALPFCFGAGSCQRHAGAARDAGFTPRILQTSGVGLDVDEPADLAELVARGAGRGGDCGRRTSALLSGGLGNRIELAIAAADGGAGKTGEAEN